MAIQQLLVAHPKKRKRKNTGILVNDCRPSCMTVTDTVLANSGSLDQLFASCGAGKVILCDWKADAWTCLATRELLLDEDEREGQNGGERFSLLSCAPLQRRSCQREQKARHACMYECNSSVLSCCDLPIRRIDRSQSCLHIKDVMLWSFRQPS